MIERVVWERPFCRLIHFGRQWTPAQKPQAKLLIVAPMSGHYATLLRGTVEAFLPFYDVYITDWADARMVPLRSRRLRPRRLHRLSDRYFPFPEQRDGAAAYDRRLPAGRAAARRRRADGSGRTIPMCRPR